MSQRNAAEENLRPADFEVWVRALANELGPANHNYLKDQPGAFQEAIEYLTSDEMLAPKELGYPAFCFLPDGRFTDNYLSIIFATAYHGHTAEGPIHGDDLKHYTSTGPADLNDPDSWGTGELAGFVGVLDPEDNGENPRLVYYKDDVPVRNLSARDENDLRRIHETVISAAQRLA